MPRLYKYVTPLTGRKIIENGTLRWSTPPTLNDPFDMQFAFQLRIDRQAARVMALDKIWRHLFGELTDRPLTEGGRIIRQRRNEFTHHMSREEFSQDHEFTGAVDETIDMLERNMAQMSATILSKFENDKILCLSDIPDSVLMWSYYAQNHAGMALRFTDKTPNNPLVKAQPVRYIDQMPSLFDEEMLSDMLAGYKGMDAGQIIDQVTYTKSSLWAHEREWRVSAYRGRSDGPYEDLPFNAKELDGAIFGVRTPDSERRALIDLLRTRYPHVELLQVKTRTDAFRLIVDSVDAGITKTV
jgi:hypothetical protein